MRDVLDQTTYYVNDLADQPKGLYLFRSEVGLGDSTLTTMLWCDNVIVTETHIDVQVAVGTTYETIGIFPIDCEWLVLASSVITTLNRRDTYVQMGRSQAAGEEARKVFTDSYERATGKVIPVKPQENRPLDDSMGKMDWDSFLKGLDDKGEAS